VIDNINAAVAERERERDEAREQLGRVLSWFKEEPVVSSFRYASATRAQLASAYQDGGLDVPDELRRFL
jgi:uncharacterized coiled-coil protein SlyX